MRIFFSDDLLLDELPESKAARICCGDPIPVRRLLGKNADVAKIGELQLELDLLILGQWRNCPDIGVGLAELANGREWNWRSSDSDLGFEFRSNIAVALDQMDERCLRAGIGGGAGSIEDSIAEAFELATGAEIEQFVLLGSGHISICAIKNGAGLARLR